jgi:hypothetical protein
MIWFTQQHGIRYRTCDKEKESEKGGLVLSLPRSIEENCTNLAPGTSFAPHLVQNTVEPGAAVVVVLLDLVVTTVSFVAPPRCVVVVVVVVTVAPASDTPVPS